MAVVYMFEYPGVTQEQYEEMARRLEIPSEGPPGGMGHYAGPMDGGWWIFEVWDSEESAQRFYDSIRPVVEASGASLPQPRRLPVYSNFGGA